jgi:hypothetical protein
MVFNLNNYSKYYLSNNDIDLDSNIKFLERWGCNGFIRNSNIKHLYIAIPKEEVDATLDFVNDRNDTSYTFDNTLAIFKEMGFNYQYKLIDENITFRGKDYSNYYVIKISIEDCHQKRYYAFCMVRHFYYDEATLIRYLRIYKFLNNDIDKIIALSAISYFSPGYTFSGRKVPLDINVTFKDLLKLYKNDNCNNLTFGMSFKKLPINNDLNYNVQSLLHSIEDFKNELKTIKKCGFFINEYDKPYNNFIFSSGDLNISPESINKLIKLNRSIYNNANFSINLPHFIYHPDKPLIIDKCALLITRPIKLSKYCTIIDPIAPKYVVNMGKSTRYTISNEIIINDYNIIKKLKNRRFVNKIANQEEFTNFPLKLLKVTKTLKNDKEIVINSKEELVNSGLNIKKYIKQPIFKNSNKHYLFFTKNDLFLHQIEVDTHIIDDKMTEFLQYNKVSKIALEKSLEVFKNSKLDIGVIIADVCKDTGDIYIIDVSPFIDNGIYATKKYLQKINDICVD